jgi:membrane-associated phospholipid phosphatase
VPVLEPRRHGPARALAAALASRGPATIFVAAVLAGWAILVALSIGAGLVLTDFVLPSDGIGHADEHVEVWLAAHRSGTLNDVSYYASGIGDILAIPALVALTTLVLLVRRHWRAAAFVLAAIAVEAATYRVTTLVIHRHRPRVHRLEQLPVNASYYSGHTAASVAVYCGLALLISSRLRSWRARVACWVVALAIPAAVAAARTYRGMHHPTDVAAGALVGVGTILVALTAARAAGARAERTA